MSPERVDCLRGLWQPSVCVGLERELMSEQSPSVESGDRVAAWHVGGRRLPAPAGASEHLRSSIAATPTPDPEVAPMLPADAVAMAAFVERADAMTIEMVRTLREQLPVTVTEDVINGVDVHRVDPVEADPRHDGHLFVYVHGGAFVLNGGEASLAEPILIAHRTGMRVLSIDYRMPPSHPAPAGTDDVMTVYRSVLEERSGRSLALGGSSGGGNMCMVTVQHAIRDGLEVPGALYLGTPGADMTETGDSVFINEGVDRTLVSYRHYVNAVRRYAGDLDLSDSLISPIYGDFGGFPPTFLVTGTRDILLSATARTHIKIREAGSVADLLVYEGMAHADYAREMASPESHHAYSELKQFLLTHLA
jgi:monoterpene epsilon-lactone hydrolase